MIIFFPVIYFTKRTSEGYCSQIACFSPMTKKRAYDDKVRDTSVFGISTVRWDELPARFLYSMLRFTKGSTQSITFWSKTLHILYCEHKTTLPCELQEECRKTKLHYFLALEKFVFPFSTSVWQIILKWVNLNDQQWECGYNELHK